MESPQGPGVSPSTLQEAGTLGGQAKKLRLGAIVLQLTTLLYKQPDVFVYL
jgi:hypothetical protein